MEEDNYKILAKIRLERAGELLNEAKDLLAREAYKSANNRAYYAIEKSLTALLATANVQTQTHKGCLKQFNILFIKDKDSFFTMQDYKIAAKAEQIRNSSDYDDFYIADKAESSEQVSNAEKIYLKIKKYVEGDNG